MGLLQSWQNAQGKPDDSADFWRGACAQAVGSAAELHGINPDCPQKSAAKGIPRWLQMQIFAFNVGLESVACNPKTSLRWQQGVSYLYFLENLACLIRSTGIQNWICSFSRKLYIGLGIASEQDCLWDFQPLTAENTTRKDFALF